MPFFDKRPGHDTAYPNQQSNVCKASHAMHQCSSGSSRDTTTTTACCVMYYPSSPHMAPIGIISQLRNYIACNFPRTRVHPSWLALPTDCRPYSIRSHGNKHPFLIYHSPTIFVPIGMLSRCQAIVLHQAMHCIRE